MTNTSQSTDIANPLVSHLNFIKYTLTTREGDNDIAFTTRLNDHDFAAGVIFFHGVHSLYRCVEIMKYPDLKFREIDMPRKSGLPATEELISLYEETINAFIEQLKNLDSKQLEEEIPSPLSGKPVKRKIWFGQSVMHTIHHVGQAVRIQGIVDRELNNVSYSFKRASDYTDLYN